MIILTLLAQVELLIFGSLRQSDMDTFWNNSFSDMLQNHKAHKETWDFMQNQVSDDWSFCFCSSGVFRTEQLLMCRLL